MAAQGLDHLYTPGSSERIVVLEDELNIELQELTTELEVNELHLDIAPKITTTVPLPKDVAYFRRERGLVIQRALQVSEAQPLRMQAEEMRVEMTIAEMLEYTSQSLPLLLHQFFLERVQNLIQSKHLHMLRWRRFCEHTSTIESMHPLYNRRLRLLMNEYRDSLQRARRLAPVKENHLAGRDNANVMLVSMEDLLIYLRWLVCHHHAMKLFNQYLKVLQWLPVTHKFEITPVDPNAEQKDESNAAKMASRYQEESSYSNNDLTSKFASTTSQEMTAPSVPLPPPLYFSLLTAVPLPSSAMIYAAAASGGGLASDEATLGLPVHQCDMDSIRPLLVFLLNLYGINWDINSIQNQADEMDLFATVNRKYRHFFIKQEHLFTFRTYDHFEHGSESWGSESSNHALLKDSNWLPFVVLTPEHEPQQEKRWTELRCQDNVDEILHFKAHFLKVKDVDRVQRTLKDHANLVRNPPPNQAVSVTSNKTPNNTREIWRKIYSDRNLQTNSENDDSGNFQDINERNADNVDLHAKPQSIRRSDSYNYYHTVQMLGLDDGEQTGTNPVTAQGCFLSFLHLRHLRLRDLQRTCLSVLNYFRSIQRTLTINDGGLSLQGDSAKKTSPQNHRFNTECEGTLGGGGGLGSHAYLHNTPVDYQISEGEFIEFADVENHDDFYTMDEGRIHVLDQKGYYIMYDSAVEDLKNLEKDLLLMATYFIEKDRKHRRFPKDSGDFDISSYAHQNVDRFGILLDIWTNECSFQEKKRELLDCYFEAYQHVTDRDEKRAIAQIITQIIHRRPRFDFEAAYFIKAYRIECAILLQETILVKNILDKQIEQQREYTLRVCREGEAHFGLPTRVIPRQPISLNFSRPALKNVYMLEFHPTLAIASHIPQALKYTNSEFQQLYKPATVQSSLILEKKVLEVAIREWQTLPHIGSSYSSQLEKDLFSGLYIEDPIFLCELAQHQVNQQELTHSARPTQREKQEGMLEAVARVLETVTLRHRLIDAVWESEILSKLYLSQAKKMGYDAAHLYLRLVQFDYASYRPFPNRAPIFITAVQENDSAVDKYVPSHLNLAIHELDENHVGRFSFRTRDGVLQVLRPGGLENIQVVLKAQIVHKNALTSAVLQASICQPVREVSKSGISAEKKTEKSLTTQQTITSATLVQKPNVPGQQKEASKAKAAPESFMSLQLEKTPVRDVMLNEFVEKKQTMGAVLKNQDELEKLKRKFISNFCNCFQVRLSHASMRAQILAYYYSMKSLLEDFPSVRDTYFMEGTVNEKKDPEEDDLPGLSSNPREIKTRPRRLLSPDGSFVLNLWFIPHHSEVLIMFKDLDDDMCYRALAFTLSIVSSLSDMLQYLCAFSRLGSSHARLGSKRMEFVSADWGGTEGIGCELREIQRDVDALSDPRDPNLVQELLLLRRDVLFLQFDTAVRHCMTDSFISTGNIHAFKNVSTDLRHALPALSNVQRRSLFSTYFTIPEPLEARDIKAKDLFPWRSFLNLNGPYPCMFWQWTQIAYYVQLCIAGLREVDRHVANGEILGVTLLMEDVLQMGQRGAKVHLDIASHGASRTTHESSQQTSHAARDPSHAVSFTSEDTSQSTTDSISQPASHATHDSSQAVSRAEGQASHGSSHDLKDVIRHLTRAARQGLQRSQHPLEAFRLLKFFLLLWKCLELMKIDWGCRRLGVEAITTSFVYREFIKNYRVDVLVPVLQSIARRLGQGELYDAINPETDVLVMPKRASEIEVRAQQLVHLLEALEVHMITEVRKRISREMSFVLSERAREENALPTDLWKRAVMRESFTTNRPHVAERFVDKLMLEATETESSITFSREHLIECLASLGRDVMIREKENFESYTMYYENMLKIHHQILYKNEQMVKHMQEQLRQAEQTMVVEVQCQMASRAYDLIMEVTALRAKILEMRQQAMTAEQEVREIARKEFMDVVQGMFDAHSRLQLCFDEFREQLHDDVQDKIALTRTWAVEAMTKLSEKFTGNPCDDLKNHKAWTKQIRNLQLEKHQLITIVIKMKAMHTWRCNHLNRIFQKMIADLRRGGEKGKKEMVEVQMLAEEQILLLRQQLVAIKRALAETEKDSNEIRRALDKELKTKKECEHRVMQKERNKLQLDGAKCASMEGLMEELNEKEKRLRMVVEQRDRSSKMQVLAQEKVRKDIDTIKRQLSHERILKLDAFHRVDELQSQVYDYETSIFGSQQLGSVPPSAAAKTRSRAVSAGNSSHVTRPVTSSGMWLLPTSWPAGRAPLQADDGSDLLNNLDYKKIQRPKTVGGRLRSRIAEQLLNELEPNHHGTVVQLEQLQLEHHRNVLP